MHRLNFPLRLLAFVLVLVLLTVRLGSYTDESFTTPIEDVLFDIAFIAATEDSGKAKPPIFKPKRAFDFACCADDGLLPVFVPAVAELILHSPFRGLSEVYLDIFVPPEAQV